MVTKTCLPSNICDSSEGSDSSDSSNSSESSESSDSSDQKNFFKNFFHKTKTFFHQKLKNSNCEKLKQIKM